MKKIAIASFVAAVLAVPAALAAQDAKEHEWLQHLAGQWETEVEVVVAPGQPPLKVKATETTRRIGQFWILTEAEAKAPALPYARALILGYDTAQKKYLGTWVDSFNAAHIGRYEGAMDAAGKTLTLVGELPHPHDGRLVKVREVIEFKSPDQKVVTTSLQGDDGNWVTLVTVNAQRTK